MTSTALPLVARSAARVRGALVALTGLVVAAVGYHALQSLGQVSPVTLDDELLFSKLAQSIAAGDGFAIRGQPFFFPAPLAVVVQAPVWLIESVPAAYSAAKIWNALVMGSAALPAYWLASRLVRTPWALMVAGATVAAPGMTYHAYLTSEAVAYPVFLLALATIVQALDKPARRWELAVVGACVLAVLARTQFALLPLAYAAAVVLLGREALRRHGLSLALLGLGATAGIATGGAALGQYVGLALADASPSELAEGSVLTAGLLPFAAGWTIMPGALAGLGLMLVRPRGRGEAGFAVITAVLVVVFSLEAAAVAALDDPRPIDRYLIYLAPLLFVAFFAYAERALQRTIAVATCAFGLAVAAWLLSVPAPDDYRHTFDSPISTAYGWIAYRVDLGFADALFGVVPLALAAFAVLARRRPLLVALSAIAISLALGQVVYAATRALGERTLEAWAASPPDWVDRTGLGPADLLVPAAASPRHSWATDIWNRDVRRVVYLEGAEPSSPSVPVETARIAPDGRLLIGGRPLRHGVLAVDHLAAAVELEGAPVASPRPGLTLYRVPDSPRVRSLAVGVFPDGWTALEARIRVWRPQVRAGAYSLELSLPPGFAPRTVTLTVAGGAQRTVRLEPGCEQRLQVPARGEGTPPLSIRVDRGDALGAGRPGLRVVGVRLEFAFGTRRPVRAGSLDPACAPAAPGP